MLTKDTPPGRYVTILADGKMHETVPQGTEGAVLRQYETSDGKKGEKWELVYSKLEARIKNVQFRDGDFGEQVVITFEDEDNEINLSQVVSSNFGEDILKKLPNVAFSEKVTIAPYAFEDEKGKQVRGVTFYQNGKKLFNFFFDPDTKTPKHGYPEFEGDKSNKDDWKIHFLKSRKFLVQYTKDNIVPKFAGAALATPEAAGIDYPEEEINPEDIPF